MQKFHYRAGKSAFVGLGLGLFGLFVGWMWFADPDSSFLSLGFAILCLAGTAKAVSDGMSDIPALAFDASGVSIRRTWGQQAVVPWSEVQAISIETFVLRYWGIIPISRTENLVVKCDGGLFGSRRLRLSAQMMQLPPGGIHQLCAMLQAAHVAAVGEAGVVMKGAGAHGWGSRSIPSLVEDAAPAGGFDADAALARYLARKEAAAAAPSSASPVGAPPPVTPVAPPRPVFGRKSQAG